MQATDALLGLRELLEAHPELINVHLTALVNSCIRLISDEVSLKYLPMCALLIFFQDASVRKTLLAFFTWLFRHVPRVRNYAAHSPFAHHSHHL